MNALFNWNWLSVVMKVVFGLAALLLSAILSYTFFSGIEPAGMSIFPFAALTLTEGGLVAWMLIFSAMKHHSIKSLIALLMVGGCLVTTITVTFAELVQLFQDHTLVSNATIKNGTLILLEVMLAAHILATISDFLIGKIELLLHGGNAPQLPPRVFVDAQEDDMPAAPQTRKLPAMPPAPQKAQIAAPQEQSSPNDERYFAALRGERTFHVDEVKTMIGESDEQLRQYYEKKIAALQAQSPKATAPLDTQASQPGQQNGHRE